MNIYEYQTKDLFRAYDISVPKGYVVESEDQIEKTLRRIETDQAVIKAQIHAGGRGKAGGVQVVDSMSKGIEVAKALLNKPLVTHQTSEEGIMVKTLYFEEACEIESEWYLSLTFNRQESCVTLVFSAYGGVDIESQDASKISKINIDPLEGLSKEGVLNLLDDVKVSNQIKKAFVDLVEKLYTLYLDKDALLIEINPLVISKENKLVALDGKMTIDDNALFRQEDLKDLQDDTRHEREREASNYGLSYVNLEGNIACMVNGAGLALATLDTLWLHGGKAANFLDVGGSASPDQIEKAFEIILKDDKVEGIFINIFGGIMKGEYIAEAIIQSFKDNNKKIPIVLRLEGSGSEAGRHMLEKENIDVIFVDSLDEGAEKIVTEIGGSN